MISERIKIVRKYTKLSQEDFGSRLSVTRNVIASYELARVEPTELFIKHLCREFNVNEEWLRSGEGDIFLEQSIDEEFAEFIAEAALSGNEKIKELMVMASKLNNKQLKAIVNFLETMVGEK